MIDPQDILDNIRGRRSWGLKELKPDPVAPELVEDLLEAARWAPNHGHTEPWRFIVYTGEGRRALGETFAEAYRLATPAERFTEAAQSVQRERVWQAPVWVAVGITPGSSPRIPEEEEILAVGAAVQNMLLLAAAHGLGSKWTTGAPSTHAHTARFVGLVAPSRLLGFVYFGWPAFEGKPGLRAALADKVTWVER